ncbi:MAG: hypothetical protein P8M22_10395 [Phycisphaerales bacterium]|nr:hypothetical protein [Phycisphaerales bacterium]
MATAGTTIRRRFWRSSIVMWMVWTLLGILLLVGFSVLSSYPSVINLVQAGTLGALGS